MLEDTTPLPPEDIVVFLPKRKKPVGKENEYRASTWRGKGMFLFGDQTRVGGLQREGLRERRWTVESLQKNDYSRREM